MKPAPSAPDSSPIRGRGAASNPPNRFERLHVEFDPNAEIAEENVSPRTEFFFDNTQSIFAKNDSPDVSFGLSLNSYRGCEHGCAYCYARAYHEFLGWSGGLDFESKILVKLRAPELLRKELSSPKWQPQSIAMSGATDCYQPAERKFQLTRKCLEVLAEFRNPIGVITKNFLVTRDRDLLAEMAKWNGVVVNLTITTLDADLAAKLEPRAARPEHRLNAIRILTEAGIPTGVMVAPIIPGLTDHEIPSILDAAAHAGATHAGYTVLRLPHSVKDVFLEWLALHQPSKAERVLSRIRELRGGELNVSDWGARIKGAGIFAEQIRALFEVSARRAGMNKKPTELAVDQFRRPGGVQLTLF
ncbi:MAG: PA0069 family radical SAM protein [Nibricoccus sp.]